MKSLWVGCIWAACGLNLSANPKIDSVRLRFIKPFDKQIFIAPLIRQRATSFQLTNALDRKNKLRYVPNNSFSTGIRITLFGIGVEGSAAIPIARRNRERFGTSTVREFQVNCFSQKWFADFYGQNYSGFYLNRSWSPLTSKDIHPQRTGLELKNSGLSFTYIFNHAHYSMRAPYQFSEHQKRSGGSVMLGLIMNRFKISNDDFIIRAEDQLYFSAGRDARFMDFVTAAVVVGYGYTVVYKNFFINATALAGPSHHWLSYSSQQAHFDIDVNLYAAYFAAIGYSGERSFMGITFHAKESKARMLETSVSNSLTTFRLVAGIRLKEKGFLEKRPKDIINRAKQKK